MAPSKPRAAPFPYDLPFADLDLRAHPEWYRTGKGEQGVLMVQPYKRELLPHWRFKTPEIAKVSADALFDMFEKYKEDEDFVGCDMARKFIQMGLTRSRRYANHVGGRKYKDKERTIAIPKPETEDPEKAASALVFKDVLDKVKADETYIALAKRHFDLYNHIAIDVEAIRATVEHEESSGEDTEKSAKRQKTH